jgi:hypothetical protein
MADSSSAGESVPTSAHVAGVFHDPAAVLVDFRVN